MSDHETTLRDAEQVLRLIGSPCPKNAQGHDHEWHTCPRCEMLHELEMRDSLARKLVLSGADALRRGAALLLVLKCAERACDADNMDAALDYVREAIRQIAPTEPTR